MGVSTNGATQQWMVFKFIMENPIQMDALGKFLYGPGHSPISGLAF
jgi:hypothetical protein